MKTIGLIFIGTKQIISYSVEMIIAQIIEQQIKLFVE
jgi:hypothetical protein